MGTFGTVKVACFEKFGELIWYPKRRMCGTHPKEDKGLRQYKLKNKSIKTKWWKRSRGSARLTGLIIDKMPFVIILVIVITCIMQSGPYLTQIKKCGKFRKITWPMSKKWLVYLCVALIKNTYPIYLLSNWRLYLPD